MQALDDNHDPDRFIPYRLQRLASLLTADFFASSAPGVSGNWAEWYVLSALAGPGASTARDISVRSGMAKAQVSRAVAALEGRALLVRARPGPDRRAEQLEMTTEGRAAHARLSQSARAYATRLLCLAGAGDLAALEQMLFSLEEGLAANPAAGGQDA